MATRGELFARLGVLKPIVDPILNAAYKVEERQIWEQDLFSSPHGEHWHVSFHASSFPGDDEKACGRQAIYSLMNVPGFNPVDRDGRAIMEAGKDVEKRIVTRFERAGLLLTEGAEADFQMGFEDQGFWLTGSPDAIILLPKENRPHVVEVKSKDHNAILEMQTGQRSFDPAHRRQVLTYIGLAHENSKRIWPDLEECIDGSILYVSRDRPGTTHEFRFRYNQEFMERGRAKLLDWKEHFLQEQLPERPKNWRWTEPPCKWCPVKKICKADYQKEIVDLKESHGIAHAKEVRGKYDYEDNKQEVIDRWYQGGETNGTK